MNVCAHQLTHHHKSIRKGLFKFGCSHQATHHHKTTQTTTNRPTTRSFSVIFALLEAGDLRVSLHAPSLVQECCRSSSVTNRSRTLTRQDWLSDQYPAIYYLDHFPALVEILLKFSFSDKFVLVFSGVVLFPDFFADQSSAPDLAFISLKLFCCRKVLSKRPLLGDLGVQEIDSKQVIGHALQSFDLSLLDKSTVV
jgi:hypothetical protein